MWKEEANCKNTEQRLMIDESKVKATCQQDILFCPIKTDEDVEYITKKKMCMHLYGNNKLNVRNMPVTLYISLL